MPFSELVHAEVCFEASHDVFMYYKKEVKVSNENSPTFFHL